MNEASAAVSHMEQDKEGIRIDINTPVLEVVNLQTFLDLNLVVNNTEIPPPGLLRTRSDMWYTGIPQIKTTTTERPRIRVRKVITPIC